MEKGREKEMEKGREEGRKKGRDGKMGGKGRREKERVKEVKALFSSLGKGEGLIFFPGGREGKLNRILGKKLIKLKKSRWGNNIKLESTIYTPD